MKWLAFKASAKKAWLKAKKFWWLIVLGLLFIVVALIGALTRNGALFASVVKLIESKQEAHDAEIETIERIHAAETEEKNKRLAEHQKRMAELEEEFASRGEELDSKKKAALKKLVDEGYNDPEKLSKEIAAAFGLKHG
jgi:flagellar biosynthesis/type III secretory pathway M-ring protein FliF/YscJ